jgi:hypothetical protein
MGRIILAKTNECLLYFVIMRAYDSEPRRHYGTGRAGTTFLVQLLIHTGLDTGFEVDTIDLSPIAGQASRRILATRMLRI